MMEITTESFEIVCDTCGKKITIWRDDLDVDVSSYDHGENGMGEEIIYTIEHEIECPCCENVISFTITGNEYPVGAYDYDSCEIFGGEFVEKPSMGMVYFRDEYEFDEAAIEATHIRKLISDIARDRELIYDVNPRDFEKIVEQLFIENGFETKLTKATRDGGKDIIATKPGINGKPVVFYVECKRYAKKNKVDVNLIRALYGVQTSDRINKACLVTSSLFTQEAREYAEEQNVMIDLIDGEELYRMIRKSDQDYYD